MKNKGKNSEDFLVGLNPTTPITLEDERSICIGPPPLFDNLLTPPVAGGDSTCLYEIHVAVASDKGELLNDKGLYSQLEDFITKDSDKDVKEINLDEGSSLVIKAHDALVRANAKYQGVFTKNSIKIGRALNLLKRAVKQKGGNWTDFTQRNFDGFISSRSYQNYMKLACGKHAEKYALLGMERLLQLIDATDGIKDLKNQDPIGTFLEMFNIPFNPDSEKRLTEFKKQIDVAVEQYKAEKEGVKLKQEMVEALVDQGMSLRKCDLEELKTIQQSNGDPNKHLSIRMETSGQKGKGETKEKRIESFLKLKSRMKEAINKIKESSKVPGDLKSSDIDELINALLELKEILDT